MFPFIAVIPSFDENEGRYTVPDTYIKAISSLNAIPLIIPYEADFKLIADNIDGILLTGGGDPSPSLWGEKPIKKCGTICKKRDSFEKEVIITAYEKDIPLLGICRGAQMIAASLGGTLFQDIKTCCPDKNEHMQTEPRSCPTHSVLLNLSSLLYTISEKHYNRVNSFHHQAIDKIPPGFIISAVSEDGITEAIECPLKSFFVGVQWHPEAMTNDETQKKIFSAFIKAAEKHQGGKLWQV